MPETVRRIWVFVGTDVPSRKIWDRGDELWEMLSQEDGDSIRHFRVVSREFLEDPKKLEEVLELMEDSPIPLNTLERVCTGWQVTEEIISSPARQPPPQVQDRPLQKQQAEDHEQQDALPRLPHRKREDLRARQGAPQAQRQAKRQAERQAEPLKSNQIREQELMR
jgi:hypothetical protein